MEEQILEQIKKLYPDIDTENEDFVNALVDIAKTIATNDGLDGSKLAIGSALLVLDMLFPSHSEEGVRSQRIDGVSQSYVAKYTTSKWRRLYDMLLNGTYDSSISIYYDGING